MQDSPSLAIQLLGAFRIVAGDTSLRLDQPRLQRLLVYLLLHRHHPRPRQQVAFTLWPDTSEEQALRNLRTLLTRLRQSLPDLDRYVEVSTYALKWRHDAPCHLDVSSFEDACAAAVEARQRGQASAAISAYERATGLYTGDLTPGWYDEWLVPERERLRDLHQTVLETLCKLLADAGRRRDALSRAQQLLRADPLHETAYRLLMQIHLDLDDRAAALRVYHTCATTLRNELGVDPSPGTQALYLRVLTLDDEPAPPPHAVTAPMTANSTPGAAALVGRQSEWGALRRAWQSAASGRAQVVLISGEAGIGKTRLAEELLAWVERQGATTAVARCYAGGVSLAYAPVAEWLRSPGVRANVQQLEGIWRSETARLLPDLLADRPDLSAPGPMTEAWQRQRFFQALNRAILGTATEGTDGAPPLLLLLDDAQWCDPDTLDWLHYLLQANATVPLMVLGTVRAEETDDDHPLHQLRLALAREALVDELSLTPLTAAETATLAGELLGRPLVAAQAAQLFQDTEGNPLFAVEMVRSGMAVGESGSSGAGESGQPLPTGNAPALPPRVRAVIRRRLALLSPGAQALAETAAVLGRAFTFAVLAHASGQDDTALVQGLDELWRRRIVREQGADAYDFSHDKIRVVAYAMLSAIRRRMLHRKVAEALVSVHATNLDAQCVSIAQHYEIAGQADRATEFYRRAAQVAQQIYANAAAVDYYQHLLESDLAKHLSPDDVCKVKLALAEVWRLTGRWAQAEAIANEALAQAEQLDDVVSQSQAQQVLADVMLLRGRYDEGLCRLVKAQEGFERTSNQAGLSRTLWTMGEIHWYQGDHGRALDALHRQLDIATRIGDQRGICESLGSLGLLHWSQGDFDQSQDYCERSIVLATVLGHRQALGRAANTLGNVGLGRRNYAFAFTWYQAAYEVAGKVGDEQTLAWALHGVAKALAELGDFQRAVAYDVRHWRILSEIGDRWSMVRGIYDFGWILRRLDIAQYAAETYQLAIALGKELGMPGFLSDMSHDLAELLLELNRRDEAEKVFGEALTAAASVTGQWLAGEDVRFNLEVLGVRLRLAQGHFTQSQTVAEIERLLGEWPSLEQQAKLHYDVWRINHLLETHRIAAAEKFHMLATSTSAILYRQRYHELTGEWLPAPDPLPDLPGVVIEGPFDIESLMIQVRSVAAKLMGDPN